MVRTLIIIALILAISGMLYFAVMFTWRANFRASALGWHMVYFSWSFVIALTSNLLRAVWQGPVIDTIRVTALFILAGVTWQRAYLFHKSLREGEHADKRIRRGDGR